MKESAREIERIKKDLCFIFNTYGLKITSEAKKKVNFLDVTLNLSTCKYQPYSKPNNIPFYVHSKSNHPLSILRNIPLSINKRLTEISSPKQLVVTNISQSTSTHRTKSSLDPRIVDETLWYNPPFSKNVSTNIGQKFLRIIDDEFPANHCLRTIIN